MPFLWAVLGFPQCAGIGPSENSSRRYGRRCGPTGKPKPVTWPPAFEESVQMNSMFFHLKRLNGALGLMLMGIASTVHGQELKSIRIGWQPTTTVEAQVAHTLAKTNILEKNGLKAEFVMFSFGPAVNEALLSGAIDVGFIGDMPSVSL